MMLITLRLRRDLERLNEISSICIFLTAFFAALLYS